MNIAIYGGSFDPFHLAHSAVISHILMNDPNIDKILVVPAFKQSGKNLAPYHLRYAMCIAVTRYFNRVEVSDIEMGTESLTIYTLQKLKQIYPNDSMRFVMGGDLIDSAKTWDGWKEIERLAPPYIVGRAGISNCEATPICPLVSSTMIRNLLKKKDYIAVSRYVFSDVLRIIKENNLYVD